MKNLNKANKLLLFLLVLAGSQFLNFKSAIAGEKSNDKMNVVFILADDLRWNSLKCTGTDFLITPNIDKLASQGIKFNNACVTTPICCSSRASLLTGQYMSRNNVTGFSAQISQEDFENTYPGVLRANGYYTGFVGKYGVGKIRKEDFDFSSIYEGRHWYLAQTNKETGEVKYINTAGKNGKLPQSEEYGDSIHTIDRNIIDCLEFLKERPKDKPFNLSLSFFAPHAEDRDTNQYLCRPSSEKYYTDVTIPVPITSTKECYEALPPFIANEKNFGRVRWHWRFDTPEKYQDYMKRYYRLVTDVDYAVGVIIKELKKQGVYENTLIVFMGDNGYFHSDHQLADKWYPYEQSIRVPLIIYDPRLPKKSRGTSNDEFALNIDIAPTILKAAGLTVPDVVQGEDLSSLYLSQKPVDWRQEFFVEHPVISTVEHIPSSQAIITPTDKYIYWPDYKFEEYFNLETDPNEVSNGISSLENQERIKLLKERFEALRESAK